MVAGIGLVYDSVLSWHFSHGNKRAVVPPGITSSIKAGRKGQPGGVINACLFYHIMVAK